MAPWTGKLIQSNLDKLTANNIDDTAAKLVNLLETRTQVQKLAILVSQRVQRAYKSTFNLQFDDKRRHIADSLVASLLRCFANLRKSIKGVPTREGLSGIPLFKADLLSAALYERSGIGAVATSLYNSLAMSADEVKAIILACLDKKYANDADKVGDALLLLEYSARELDREDERAMNSIMERVQEQLDCVPDVASERKTCGDRLIPSFYDRYWDLVEKRKESWRESPYATSVNPSTVTAAAVTAAMSKDQLSKSSPATTDLIDELPVTPTKGTDPAQESLWLSNFAPVEVTSARKGSDSKAEGITFPSRKEMQKSTTSLASMGSKPRKRCPSCSREAIPAQVDDEYAQVAYGQAMGHPDIPRKEELLSTSSAVEENTVPTVSFDDVDDCLWFNLGTQAGSPIKIKFDADTRLGDAKSIARLLAASMTSQSTQGEKSVDCPPIQFLPNGRVGQMLKSAVTKDIFVQYPHDMTLLQARNIGDSLANAVESYTR